jgi:hypothetical protein
MTTRHGTIMRRREENRYVEIKCRQVVLLSNSSYTSFPSINA